MNSNGNQRDSPHLLESYDKNFHFAIEELKGVHESRFILAERTPPTMWVIAEFDDHKYRKIFNIFCNDP